MKGNIHKRLYHEDKFGRRFYCQHARLGTLHIDKKAEKTQERRFAKEESSEQENEYENSDE